MSSGEPEDPITKSPDPRLQASRVFVGNLQSEKTNKEEMKNVFGKYGEILGLSIFKGYAFIQFKEIHEARGAVAGEHQKPFHGWKMDIRLASEGRKKATPGGPNASLTGAVVTSAQFAHVDPSLKHFMDKPVPGGMQSSTGEKAFPRKPPPVAPYGVFGAAGRGRPPFPHTGSGPEDPTRDPFYQHEMRFGTPGHRPPAPRPAGDPFYDHLYDNITPRGLRPLTPRAPISLSRDYHHQQDYHGIDTPAGPGYRPDDNRFDRQGVLGDGPGMELSNTQAPQPVEKSESKPRKEVGFERPYDCAILATYDKDLKPYAEMVERRLLELNLNVDLLFLIKNEQMMKVMESLARRGLLYVIGIEPQNARTNTISLYIFQGTPEKHSTIPLEDALSLLSRHFTAYLNRLRSGSEQPSLNFLLHLLADSKHLSKEEIERIMDHLRSRIGEEKPEPQQQQQAPPQMAPASMASSAPLVDQEPKPVGATPPVTAQGSVTSDIQKRIMSILQGGGKPAAQDTDNRVVQPPKIDAEPVGQQAPPWTSGPKPLFATPSTSDTEAIRQQQEALKMMEQHQQQSIQQIQGSGVGVYDSQAPLATQMGVNSYQGEFAQPFQRVDMTNLPR